MYILESDAQKLPDRVLKQLRLEPSRSRHLPLQLHARRLTLPPLQLSVCCPPPKYFTLVSRLLQLTLPLQDERG